MREPDTGSERPRRWAVLTSGDIPHTLHIGAVTFIRGQVPNQMVCRQAVEDKACAGD
jgi:hypothetical protein